MRKLRKNVKRGMIALAAAAVLSALPAGKKEPPVFSTCNLTHSLPEEKIPLNQVQQPVSLEDYQKLNPSVKYLLIFEDEGEERRIPVVMTTDASYALSHDLLGRSEKAGTVFTDVFSYEPMNLVIYGHSSSYRDVQFTFLKKMREAEYYNQHSVFRLVTESKEKYCQIVSMGEYDMNQESTYTDWALPEYENEDAVKQMFRETVPYLLRHTDGFVYQGQQIITLVTCNTDKDDVRYVLQALCV